jgi:hypothetical protein
MSFWVSLTGEDGNIIDVSSFEEGGTYQVGGCNRADLNITYNYSPYYYEVLDTDNGLRWLDGKEASECIDRLQKSVDVLGVEHSDNYWDSTKGNAGYALSILLGWARKNPQAVFRVN